MKSKDICFKSTKEEVAKFFAEYFRINEDVYNNLINEYISGDILPNLSQEDLSYLGLRKISIMKWGQYHDKNKDKFKGDKIKEEISFNSTIEDVTKFFKSYLDFGKNSKNLNGKMLFELKEEDMKKLGMKLGQRKRLINYIKQLKKNKLNKNKFIKITITENSTEEEVAKFLKDKLHFSQESIDCLGLEGESFFMIEYSDIEDLDDLKEEEKENWKMLFKQMHLLNDLQNGDINFSFLKEFMEEDKVFENKIKIMTPDDAEAEKLYKKLKCDLEKCQKDLDNIEIIIDYYLTFFPNTKEDIINILQKKDKEYRNEKKIKELINMDIKNFINIKNFYLNEVIEESKNIKYKNSSFFMIIYETHIEKDKSDKSEEKIFKESINDYNNILKEIIEKLELKLPLFEIKHIQLIIKATLKPEFDLNKEINLIKQEFSSLNKTNYILNNFKNDFSFFIEQSQFIKLIEGIVQFMEYNYKINGKKDTKCFANLRIIYNSLITNGFNEANINEFINLLKENEYYINNENILIKLYRALLEEKESLSFLKNIKDSFLNKNLFLNSIEINNIIHLFIFFKNLLINKSIQTDKDFIKVYNNEIAKNKNILNIINDIKNKYYYFINKEESNKTNKKTIENDKNIINDVEKNKEILINENNNYNNPELNTFKIIFNYNCNIITIHGNINDKMKNIINKFLTKTKTDISSLFFLYAGKIINQDSLLSKILSREDRQKNQMNILVNSISDDENDENINSVIKSKEVICPKCFHHINLKIKDFKISLFECRNNHYINDITLKDFQKTQNIDLKNIKCNICNNKNKFNTYKNEFYTCLTCDKNLCPLCKSTHEKTHQIINYDKIEYTCAKHLESYNSYCRNCKKNLCIKCEKEHNNHEKIYYGTILPDYDEIKLKIEEIGKYVNQFNQNIERIIQKLKEYKENINEYCNICIDIMKNVENKERNYEILNNINEISNNRILEYIKSVVEEKNIKNKLNLIFEAFDKIGIINDDMITLIYKINPNDNSIKIFDSVFVKNNKDNCKIIYENKEFELSEYFNVESKNQKLMIKLKGISRITNANKMFYECIKLVSIPDIQKFDVSNISEMNEMFIGCSADLIIPEKFIKK